jgi:hypothetical protein
MDRSSLVLRLEVARQYYSGVIVEGWFDAFRVGGPAMLLMGSHLNDKQLRLIADAFRGRSVVWLLDPDLYERNDQVARRHRLSEMLGGRLSEIKLPCDFDPAALHAPLLKLYLRQEAGRQGVTISFKRVH